MVAELVGLGNFYLKSSWWAMQHYPISTIFKGGGHLELRMRIFFWSSVPVPNAAMYLRGLQIYCSTTKGNTAIKCALMRVGISVLANSSQIGETDISVSVVVRGAPGLFPITVKVRISADISVTTNQCRLYWYQWNPTDKPTLHLGQSIFFICFAFPWHLKN